MRGLHAKHSKVSNTVLDTFARWNLRRYNPFGLFPLQLSEHPRDVRNRSPPSARSTRKTNCRCSELRSTHESLPIVTRSLLRPKPPSNGALTRHLRRSAQHISHERLAQVLTSTTSRSTSKTYRTVSQGNTCHKKNENRHFDRRRWSIHREYSPWQWDTAATRRDCRQYDVSSLNLSQATWHQNLSRRRWSNRGQDSPRPCCTASHSSSRPLREAQQRSSAQFRISPRDRANANTVHCSPGCSTQRLAQPPTRTAVNSTSDGIIAETTHRERERERPLVDNFSRVVSDARLDGWRSKKKRRQRRRGRGRPRWRRTSRSRRRRREKEKKKKKKKNKHQSKKKNRQKKTRRDTQWLWRGPSTRPQKKKGRREFKKKEERYDAFLEKKKGSPHEPARAMAKQRTQWWNAEERRGGTQRLY